MENLRLGNILTNIAELSKANPDQKKALLLMSAARTIRDYPGDIEKVYYEGRLRDLPGMNELAYKYTDQYFSEGYIEEYQEITSEYSEGLLKLIRMSGLGRKKMEKIYRTLGTKDIKDLKDKIYSKDISKYLDDFTVDRLKATIGYYENVRGYMPRGYMENLIKPFMLKVRGIKEVKKLELVGSFRRRKAAVGDVDLIVLTEFNNKELNRELSKRFLDSLLKFEGISSKKSQKIIGESISYRYRTKFGLDLEVILATENNWALQLFYCTGSKRHISLIENTARDKGFCKQGRVHFQKPALSEEEIYDNLGLCFIPPELREGKDEIYLARTGNMPNLLSIKDIRGDLHTHSKWSDGLIEDKEFSEIIDKYGYEYLALTDHSESNIHGNGLDGERLLDKLNHRGSFNEISKKAKILMGSEVDIKAGGRLDYREEILSKLDIVIGSMHSSYKYSSRENNLRVSNALKNKYVDFIGHPTAVVFDNRAPHFIDMDKVIEDARRYNKGLEINSYFLRLDLNEENARKAKQAGIKIVINTDSHRPANLDNIKLGVDIARRAGLGREDVLNTCSWDEILKWKANR
ncbi:MAG: PHP domain-containing protein [Actinomycetota bacterium]